MNTSCAAERCTMYVFICLQVTTGDIYNILELLRPLLYETLRGECCMTLSVPSIVTVCAVVICVRQATNGYAVDL
jgi:hypothetical protein